MLRILNSKLICLAIAACIQTPNVHAMDDRVEWVFEIPSNPPGSFVGVGQDGTVYVTDNTTLYSMSPDGQLLWSLDGAGGGQPLSTGIDGTIYTSLNGKGIAAVNPDGTLQWKYDPPFDQRNIAGPNVGPDGKIYAMQERRDGQGHGMYAVNSDGRLDWTNVGDPPVGRADLGHAQIVFDSDRLYTGVEGFRGSFPASRCWSLDGQQLWHTGSGGLSIPATTFPELRPGGGVLFRAGQNGVMALDPDGNVDWKTEHPSGAGLVIGPAAGSNGNIYAGDWLGIDLWSLNPDGSTRWVIDSEDGNTVHSLTVAPDDSVVVATGVPGWTDAWLRGYHPANGDLLWHVDFPHEDDLPPYIYTSKTAFSPDSQTAYITIRYWDDSVDHSYLYAIRIGNLATYALGIDNLVGGSDATFTITDSTPNGQQFIAYSLRGLGSTPVTKLNITLDLSKPALVTSGKADRHGTFEKSIPIPSSVSGRTVWFQGAELNRTTSAFNVVVQ